MSFTSILVTKENGVGRIQINRPQALNALNQQVMSEIVEILSNYDQDPEVTCILLHGNEQAFAAGADIKEMVDQSAVAMHLSRYISLWDVIYKTKKPIVAAVSGFALGGGCELAMVCDIVLASESARFGQPEINIGVLPGAGGTQRLTRAVGKSLAMEMVLTGRMISAQEAKAVGLVSRVVPVEAYLAEGIKLAEEIAAKSSVAARLAKQAVLASFEGPLAQGVEAERLLFTLTFASEDQKEGMKAFVEKRKPEWKGR